MAKRIPFVLLSYVASVSIIVTAAVSDVGDPVPCNRFYTWDLPFGVIILLVVPAFAGYFIHAELHDKESV